MLAIVDSSNDNLAYEKLCEISSFTDPTIVKFEVLTSLYFDDIDSNLLKNIDLYYVVYENKVIQMDYLIFRDGKEYDEKLVEKVIFDVLPDKYYPWLNLKRTKERDSNIFYIKSSQTEAVSDTVCFKRFKDSYGLLDCLTLDPVLK